MILKRKIYPVVMALTLGWATASLAKPPPPDLSAIHSIGVISDLGDQAEIEFIGFTAFGNKYGHLPIADWDINAAIMSDVQAALGDQFALKPASLDPEVYEAMDRSIFSGGRHMNLKEAIQSLPPAGIDAYLVFLKSSWSLPYPSNQSMKGLGVYRQSAGMMEPDVQDHLGEAIVHATYWVYLVDAKSGRLIADHEGESAHKETQSLTDQLLLKRSPPHGPHAYTQQTTWPTTVEALTDDEKQTLHDDVVGLLAGSIGHTLHEMGFAADPSPPAPPAPSDQPAVAADAKP